MPTIDIPQDVKLSALYERAIGEEGLMSWITKEKSVLFFKYWQIIGFILNWGFYGVLMAQTYLYYISFPKDSPSVKAFVIALFTIETAQSLLVMRDAFSVYGAGYGDISLLNNTPLIWLSVPIMSGVVSAVVQCFFAYRLAVFSGSNILGLAIAMLALTEGIAAQIVGIQLKELLSFPQLQSAAFVSKSVWMGGSALCDIIIASLMSYFLWMKNDGLRDTGLYVNRLMRLFIETGTITAIAAIADLSIFLAFKHNNFHIVPCLIMSKFYSNTALAIMNSRMHIRGGRNALPSADVATIGTLIFTPENELGNSSVGHQDSRPRRSLQAQTRGGVSVISVPVGRLESVSEQHWRSDYSTHSAEKGKEDSQSETLRSELPEKAHMEICAV